MLTHTDVWCSLPLLVQKYLLTGDHPTKLEMTMNHHRTHMCHTVDDSSILVGALRNKLVLKDGTNICSRNVSQRPFLCLRQKVWVPLLGRRTAPTELYEKFFFQNRGLGY